MYHVGYMVVANLNTSRVSNTDVAKKYVIVGYFQIIRFQNQNVRKESVSSLNYEKRREK